MKEKKIQNTNCTNIEKYHLRFFLTPYCNLGCFYCNPNHKFLGKKIISKTDLMNILKAGRQLGISKLHWTGGEPLLRPEFPDLVAYAKKIGYKEQAITSNGTLLQGKCALLNKKGLNRLNISIDTLKREKFISISGHDKLPKILSVFHEAAKTFELVKINIVILKENIDEVESFIKLASKYNNVVLKFIELSPNNPVFYNNNPRLRNNHVSRKKFLKKLSSIGEFEKDLSVNGENPNCEYYKYLKSGVRFGLITSPSYSFKCGDCRKIRISPFGEMGVCINSKKYKITGKPLPEILKIMGKAINEREQFNKKYPDRLHLSKKFGHWRFGDLSKW